MWAFLKRRRSDFRSAEYWAERYASGRTSGPGSAGRLASYKAEFINRLVAEREITSVIEFGSGDGSQVALFDFANYAGIDVVPQVIDAARERFSEREGWSFLTESEYAADPFRRDMSMSLDVIYHLVEDGVFERYMHQLVNAAERFILIYASDVDAQPRSRHVRHRAYSRWMARSAPEWSVAGTWEHPFPLTGGEDPQQTSFAFFRLYVRGPAQGS